MKLTEIQQPNIEQILHQLNITDYEITNEGVNVFGNVNIPEHYTEIPFQFNIVSGNFDCSYTRITSLQGAPREVGENFVCAFTYIDSLRGAPREVGVNIICGFTNIRGKPDTTGINIGGQLYWK